MLDADAILKWMGLLALPCLFVALLIGGCLRLASGLLSLRLGSRFVLCVGTLAAIVVLLTCAFEMIAVTLHGPSTHVDADIVVGLAVVCVVIWLSTLPLRMALRDDAPRRAWRLGKFSLRSLIAFMAGVTVPFLLIRFYEYDIVGGSWFEARSIVSLIFFGFIGAVFGGILASLVADFLGSEKQENVAKPLGLVIPPAVDAERIGSSREIESERCRRPVRLRRSWRVTGTSVHRRLGTCQPLGPRTRRTIRR